MKRKNILLLTMIVSPTRGSESSVAWNHIRFMSKYHNIHVLYGSSLFELGDTTEMDEYLKTHHLENVTFHAVPPSKLSTFIFSTNNYKRFMYARYVVYLAFRFWHKDVYKYAKELIKENDFDLVHFLGPIGYREPGQLWKLDLPYIRGPVDGTYQRPLALFSALRAKEKIVFSIRNIINWFQLRCSIGLRRSLKRTDVLMTTTTRVQSDFLKVHNKESILLPENSIADLHGLNHSKFNIITNKVELIMVGGIEGRKGLIMVLQALNSISNRNFRLNVVGHDSTMAATCKKFVEDNNLQDNVVFHGSVPRKKVFSMMNDSHLHIISSLSEAHTTVQWEAMSVGLPTLTLDHCGMGDVINKRNGFKIPITTYNETINNMSLELKRVLDSPQILIDVANTTIKEAEKYSWTKRVEFFNDLYSKF